MTRRDFCQTAFEMAQIFWLAPSALAYNSLSCLETDAKTRVRECEILVDFHNPSDKALLINLQCISEKKYARLHWNVPKFSRSHLRCSHIALYCAGRGRKK